MNEEYSEYLNSEAWKTLRNKRLAIAKFRCAACSSKNRVHAHHLTYERIFKEDMADLLPLCKDHHEVAERLIRKGSLSRRGDVLFLATETIRLVIERQEYHTPARFIDKPKRHSGRKQYQAKPKNSMQEKLINDPEFVGILVLKGKKFKQAVRRMFSRYENFGEIAANCHALHHRRRKV